KSKLISLNEAATRTRLLGEETFAKNNENSVIRILGFEVDRRGYPRKSLWDKIIKKMKKQ
ncbi:23450_t:CDS:1, partial [Gigaspora rosea]